MSESLLDDYNDLDDLCTIYDTKKRVLKGGLALERLEFYLVPVPAPKRALASSVFKASIITGIH
jgi:hypothetical protein